MLSIDLGSDTSRAAKTNEALEKLEECEFIIGAARNLGQNKVIGNEAIVRLKNALRELGRKYDLSKALAVATAAFRKAENTNLIFGELEEEFGITFRLTSTQTGVKPSVLGMQSGLLALNLHQEFGFCNLGGASCELPFRENYLSFDFGIMSFYEGFKMTSNETFRVLPPLQTKDKKLLTQTLTKDKKLKALAFRALEVVKGPRKVLRKQKIKRVVLNSGVPTSLTVFRLRLSYENCDVKRVNGMRVLSWDFLNFALKLWYMSESEACFWVGNIRKNYLIAGAFLLFVLSDKEELIIIDEGLREGVCVTYYKGLS